MLGGSGGSGGLGFDGGVGVGAGGVGVGVGGVGGEVVPSPGLSGVVGVGVAATVLVGNCRPRP